MKTRAAIVVLFLCALILGALLLRPAARSSDETAERDGDDAEAPIVAPSRVVTEEGETRVVLDTAEIRRLGLTTARLGAAGSEAGRRLAAQVVPEPERTVTLRAPVAGRLASATERAWPALGERIEAGRAVARVSDAQPLAAPISGVVTAIAARPGEIVEAGQVLLELADNSRPVVRIPWPAEAGRPRTSVTLLPPGGSASVSATLVGPASEADALTRLPVYLYRARSRWTGALPGTSISAVLSQSDQRSGVLVPDASVVQWEGFAWTYILRGAGRYARVRVPTDRPATGGWIAGAPLAEGDSVVVTGVQELLSEEFRSRVTVGEESGE